MRAQRLSPAGPCLPSLPRRWPRSPAPEPPPSSRFSGASEPQSERARPLPSGSHDCAVASEVPAGAATLGSFSFARGTAGEVGRAGVRARPAEGEDGNPRDLELSDPARHGEGAQEEGEPRCSSGSPTPFPRRHDDPSERRPRGPRGRAAQGGGERRAAALACIHQQPGIQGTARTCPRRTQTHSPSLPLSVHLCFLPTGLAPEPEMCP